MQKNEIFKIIIDIISFAFKVKPKDWSVWQMNTIVSAKRIFANANLQRF